MKEILNITFMVKVNYIETTTVDQQPIFVMSEEMKTQKKLSFKAQ